MRVRFFVPVAIAAGALLYGVPAAADLGERVEALVANEAGLEPVGKLFTDNAPKKKYKRDWNVELDKDVCYFFSIAGGDSIEKLSVALYDPADDKVESDSAKTNEILIKHCAFETGRYRVNVNVKDGSGDFAMGVFSKANAGVAGLSALLDKVAAQVVPGATKIGTPYSARGESGLISNKESKWEVSLELGKCYALVAVGDDSVRGLRIRLTEKDGTEVAPTAEGASHTSLSLCPGKTGMYAIVASVTKGAGGFLLGVYNKGASDSEMQAAKKSLEDKATGGFGGCPNADDPGCGKSRDGKSPMQASDYAEVVGEMRKKSGDDERVEHLRLSMTRYYVTVMQLSHILSFIDEDKHKLAVVEAAAARVVDPENANVIKNGFGWKHMANKAYKRISEGG